MAFAAPALTMAGKTLLHKGLAGETIKFTRLKMGDGSLTTQNPAELTDLIHTVTEIDIETLNRKDNYVSIRGIFSNQSLSAGFYWREFGLFAQDPDKGEILYCYSNAGDLAEYITSADASEIVKKLTMSVAISDVQDIVLVADDSIVFATLDDLEALEQSVNASITNITQVIQQVTGTDISGGGEITVDGSMVVTLTHAKTGTVHAFSGLGDRTGLVPCQFKSAAGYTEGDTATIDGVDYTITLTGADAPETDLFVSGKSILVDVDTEAKTINFKAGGGLTKAKLALADATEDTVFNGRTYYAGDKTLRTGRALSQATDVAPENLFNGKKAYDNAGNLVTGEFSIGGVFKQYKVAAGGQVSVGGFVKFVNEQIGTKAEYVERDAKSYQFTTTLVNKGYKAFALDNTHCLIISCASAKCLASIVTMDLDAKNVSYTEYTIGSNGSANYHSQKPWVMKVSSDQYLYLLINSSQVISGKIITINSDYTITVSSASGKSVSLKHSSATSTIYDWGSEGHYPFCQLSSNTFACIGTSYISSTSMYHCMICGTLSGTTLTFGSRVLLATIDISSTTNYTGCYLERISDTHCLYVRGNADRTKRASIISVSNNTPTMGSETTLNSNAHINMKSVGVYTSDDGNYGCINDSISNPYDSLITFSLNLSARTISVGTTYTTSISDCDTVQVRSLGGNYGLFVAYSWGNLSPSNGSEGNIQFLMFKQNGTSLTLGTRRIYKLGYYTGESDEDVGYLDQLGIDKINDDTAILLLQLNGSHNSSYTGVGMFIPVHLDFENLDCGVSELVPVYSDCVDSYAACDTIAGISMGNKTAGEIVDCYIAEGAGYTRLQYIQSSGTQYIDTGISGGTNAEYEIVFDTLGLTTTNYDQYFAGDKEAAIPKLYLNGSVQIESHSSGSNVTTSLFSSEGKHTVKVTSDGNISLDGTRVNSNVYTAGIGWGTLSMWIFCSHGEPTLYATMKLYSLKMWTDGELVRDYIPCINPSGEYGLYDRVEKEFYSNSGTGTFTGE